MLAVSQAKLFDQLADLFLFLACDIGNDQVLVGCEADIAGMNFGDFP